MLGVVPCACLFFRSNSLIVLSLLIGGEEMGADAVPAISDMTAASVVGAAPTRVLAATAGVLKVGNRTDDVGTGAESSVPGRFLLTAAMLLVVAAMELVAGAVVVVGIPAAVPVTGSTSATAGLAAGRVAATAGEALDVTTGVGVVGTGEAGGMAVAGGADDGVGPDADVTDAVCVGARAAAVTAAMAAVLLAAALTALVFASLRAFSAVARRYMEK